MTSKLSISETIFTFLSVISFSIILLICINSGKLKFLYVSLFVFILPLIFIYFNSKSVPILSFLIYTIIGLQLFIRFIIPITPELTFVSISLFLPVLFYHNKSSNLINFPFKISILFLFLGFYLSICSTILKPEGHNFFNFYYDFFIISGLCFFYCIYYLLSTKLICHSILIDILIFSGLFFVLLAFSRYFLSFSLNSIFNERFGYSIGYNPNLLASILDLIFPLSLFNLFRSKETIKKYYYSISSMILLITLLLTSSRGSLFGLTLLYFYIIFRFKRSFKIVVPLLLVPFLVYLIFNDTLISRVFSPTYYDLLSSAGRLELLKSGFKILKENFYIFGIGLNNFSVVKFRYGFPLWFDPDMAMSSHNSYLEFWIGWGLFGLIGWLLILIKNVYFIFKNTSKNKDQLYGVSFAITSFFLHGFVDSSIADFSIMLIFFTLLALSSYMIQTN